MAHLLIPAESAVSLPGPPAAELQIFDGSDFDLSIRFNLAALPTSANFIFRFYNTFGQDGAAWDFDGGNNRVRFRAFSGGTTTNNTCTYATLGVTTGTDTWLRLHYNSGNLDWYLSTSDVSDPDDVTWGAAKQSSAFAPASWTDAAAGAVPTLYNSGETAPSALQGIHYRQTWKDSAGTRVLDADPSDPTTWNCPAKDSFTEKANGATVTLQGDAELVGACPSPGGGNRMGGTGAIRRSPVGR